MPNYCTFVVHIFHGYVLVMIFMFSISWMSISPEFSHFKFHIKIIPTGKDIHYLIWIDFFYFKHSTNSQKHPELRMWRWNGNLCEELAVNVRGDYIKVTNAKVIVVTSLLHMLTLVHL